MPRNNWGTSVLCPVHEGLGYNCAVGHCQVCGRGTSSRAYVLCADCAEQRGSCQVCEKKVKVKRRKR